MRTLQFLLIAPLLTLFAVALSAQEPAVAAPPATQASAKLAKVSVTGSKHFSSEQILPEAGLSAGASVTRADLQAAADKLTQSGMFATVGYRFSSAPDGVSVEYQVTDAPMLPVGFDNFPWVSDDDLIAAIKAGVPFFDGTAPANGSILDQMGAAMSKFLQTKAIFVKITHAPMSDPLTNQMTLEFLSAGAQEDVKSVDFSDALANANPAIQQRLADLIGKPYSLTTLKLFEFEQVRPVYLGRGLLHITFRPPVVQASLPTADSAPTVVVHVQIDPGVAYSWGGVTWTGNSALSTAELDGLVKFKPGDPTDGTKIQALWLAVADAYGRKGYLDATATPSPQFDDESHRVNYTVAIAEGPQYKMGNLVLSGLSVEGEKHVRGAWAIAPGAIFDETFYDAFVDGGAKQSFGTIPYDYQRIDHFLDKNPQAGTVNVMLDFK